MKGLMLPAGSSRGKTRRDSGIGNKCEQRRKFLPVTHHYWSPEASLFSVICRPFHKELTYSPDKVACSKLRYAFKQRVPDVYSKSLVFVCDDVCSTTIHLNHGVILSLQTEARNALNRMNSGCYVAYGFTLVSSFLFYFSHAKVVVTLHRDHILLF